MGIAVALLAVRPLQGFDTWWHLASGREMARTGRLLSSEPFTFTAAGKPWMNHEWLWQLGSFAAFRLVDGPPGDEEIDAGRVSSTERAAAIDNRDRSEEKGASALVLLNAALLSVPFVLGYATLRGAGAGMFVASSVALFCAWGARGRFLARPEAVTLLLAGATLFLLDRARRSGRRGPLVILPALIALGANFHPGVIVLPVLVSLYLIGDRMGSALGRPARLPVASAGAACLALAALAATAATPSGVRIWSTPFTLSGIVKGEHYYNPEWLPALPSVAPSLYVAIAFVLALLLACRVSGRRGIDAASLLPQAGLAALALSGVRHVGLFFVALPFGCAHMIGRLPVLAAPGGESRASRSRRWWEPGAAAGLAGATAAFLFLAGEIGLGVDRSTTPVDACRFIALHEPRGRLYNDVRFGGYLIWRFGPRRAVFIDGRNELFAPLLQELSGIYSGESSYNAWLDLVRRFAIEGALVRYSPDKMGVVYPAAGDLPPRRGYRAFSAYLFPQSGWALVYWDDTAMLFLRRGSENRALIDRFAYRSVNPEDAEYVLQKAVEDPRFRESLQQDLTRRLSEPPSCERARILLGHLRQLPQQSASGAPDRPPSGS